MLENLIVDPEFEEKIPRLSEDEFQLLEQLILEEGRIKDPIVTWNGIIVDGHNRYRVMLKHPEIQIPFDIYEKEFPDRFAAIAWICKNQLGRRNLTPEDRKYLIGKQYEAEKQSVGAPEGNQNRSFQWYQNDTIENRRTSERIAKENNVSRSSVVRAERFAQGVDAAEEAVPGARKEILSGRVKATDKAIASIAKADPEERPQMVDLILHPPEKTKKTDEDEEESDESPPVTPLEEAEDEPDETATPILLAPTTEEDMLYEMEDALSAAIWRWNNCKSTYPEHLKSRSGQQQVKKLADEAMKFFREVKQGGLWK
ncbi:hypothetical protein [Pseudoflavonifractor phocaeensis]|uniref:hypothetical protein n=1 Tax=Pseudoflavonifractor phocaeensis TaxID=1870988 RepID=UPI001F1AFBEB|nr:hypothetical protein [Pseudoflavonifractor phocaeensis]MCF2662331.1 hypothetical protein [Pseudoflavonifractor phocaeensis]